MNKSPKHIQDAETLRNKLSALESCVEDYFNKSVDRYMPRIGARLKSAVQNSAVSEDDKETCKYVLCEIENARASLRTAIHSLESLDDNFNPKPAKLLVEEGARVMPKDKAIEKYSAFFDLTCEITVVRVMGPMCELAFTGTDGDASSCIVQASHFAAIR